MKSGELPHVMSPDSVSVGAEDYEFKNENKSAGVESERSEFTRPLSNGSRLH